MRQILGSPIYVFRKTTVDTWGTRRDSVAAGREATIGNNGISTAWDGSCRRLMFVEVKALKVERDCSSVAAGGTLPEQPCSQHGKSSLANLANYAAAH